MTEHDKNLLRAILAGKALEIDGLGRGNWSPTTVHRALEWIADGFGGALRIAPVQPLALEDIHGNIAGFA